MSELKPCPFCGGEGKKEGTIINGKNIVTIVCRECGATGPFRVVNHPRVKDENNPAIEAWNHREVVE